MGRQTQMPSDTHPITFNSVSGAVNRHASTPGSRYSHIKRKQSNPPLYSPSTPATSLPASRHCAANSDATAAMPIVGCDYGQIGCIVFHPASQDHPRNRLSRLIRHTRV